MGTRSLTHFVTGDGKTIVTMYTQFDGYPSGVGAEIARILAPRELVNGYNDAKTQTNGMGCAAALVIAAMKGDSAGDVYLHPPGTNDIWEEYVYRVYPVGDADGGQRHINMSVTLAHSGQEIWDGPIAQYDATEVEKLEDALDENEG